MRIVGIEFPRLEPLQARVLDIGCAQGWAVLEAAQQGAYAFGLDLSPELLRKARENQDRRPAPRSLPSYALGKCHRVPLRSSSFDLVLCTELIEHTLETEATLAEIQRLLKPGGQCILSIPNKRVEDTITRFSATFLAYSGHVKQFTLADITHALARCGLTVERVQRKYFEWSVYWLAMAVLGQVPAVDRRDDRYGLDSPPKRRWEAFNYYYKRFWKRAVEWKLGLPILWLGNQVFPKSYVLVCVKA
ncbi:MAG: class I SAM-dependent methyltransferase [Chloroflexi bacterium]|nr:class I SAM-dependent methyltransferase [Chloroflexota bacterium]